MANVKTNAMRILDQHKIKYNSYAYGNGEAVSGDVVAREIGKDPNSVFKTLVTEGKSKEHYVFVVPVLCELDLKKAAAAVGEKSIAMIKSKELLPTTGYIHGGCSPIGMKKQYPTFIDLTAADYKKIYVSAGQRGLQLCLNPKELAAFVKADFCDVTAD